jgi:hypothetical protein
MSHPFRLKDGCELSHDFTIPIESCIPSLMLVLINRFTTWDFIFICVNVETRRYCPFARANEVNQFVPDFDVVSKCSGAVGKVKIYEVSLDVEQWTAFGQFPM